MKSVSLIAMGNSLFSYLQDFEREYRKPTDEAWAINSAGVWLSDLMIDKIIAMDNFRRDERMDGGKHRQYVQNIVYERGLRVISDVADPAWLNVSAYPLKHVLSNIWPDAKQDSEIMPMLTNTCAFALALAITEGFQEIHLYGYEFRRPDQPSQLYYEADKHSDKPSWWPYHMQEVVKWRRDMEPGEPCTMFLIGVAHARGIKIVVPRGSTICDRDRMFYYYGYQIQPEPFATLPPIETEFVDEDGESISFVERKVPRYDESKL